MERLVCGGSSLDLSRAHVMGILNVTPDSFSDGGQLHESGRLSVERALLKSQKMLSDGASIIDIGGESTRPGAKPVAAQQEMDRVIPVVECVVKELGAIVSVDTSSPSVMLEAAKAGAGMINDVRALQREGAVEAAKVTGLPVCLMHMQGEPEMMQKMPHYDDVLEEVYGFFMSRISTCVDAGIAQDKLLLDPGFGFGKSMAHNLFLLRHLSRFKALGNPLMVGLSRKSVIADVLGGCIVDERLPGSLVLAAMATERGADIIRVHDVKETVDALKIVQAVLDK